MADRIENHNSSKLGEIFIRNFIIPKFENEGYRYLIFSYSSSLGITYISDKSLIRKKCTFCCRPLILEAGVEMANNFNITAKKHENCLAGVYYEFAMEGNPLESTSKHKKKFDFFKKFIEVKFNEILKELPNEKKLFCTVIFSKYTGISYVSNIDTLGEFVHDYTMEEIQQAVYEAEEKGYEVSEKIISDYAKALIFVLNRP